MPFATPLAFASLKEKPLEEKRREEKRREEKRRVRFFDSEREQRLVELRLGI